MNAHRIALGACLLVASMTATAQTASNLVERGLAAYLKGTTSDVMQTWLKGSAMEGNPQALTQANSLKAIEDFYGRPTSFEVLGEHPISTKARNVFFSIHYAKGVAFGRMQAYLTPSGEWISTETRFATEATQVLPSYLAVGQR